MCKRDMQALDIDTDTWEILASDRSSWRSTLHYKLQTGEENQVEAAAVKRESRKEAEANRITVPCTAADRQLPTHTCNTCVRACHSRIELYSPQKAMYNFVGQYVYIHCQSRPVEAYYFI